MVQIYFLLVLSNIVMGFILAKDFLNGKLNNFLVINQLLSSDILKVTVGCIGSIIGLLALFLRYSGNLVIIGDLIPALTSMICGITLFIEYISNEENNDSTIINFFIGVFLKRRTLLGIVALCVGIIHFIAPSVEFL